MRDAFLSDSAWPETSETVTIGQSANASVEIEMLGYIHRFQGYIVQDTTNETTTISDQDGTGKLQRAIADDPNGIFATSYRDMEDQGILLPVRDLTINYKQPALYDDLVTVKTSLFKRPTVKVIFDYTMHNQKGELLCDARTTLVFVDATTRKPIKTPDFFNELMDSCFN